MTSHALTCPACGARFIVAADDVPTTGVQLFGLCGACGRASQLEHDALVPVDETERADDAGLDVQRPRVVVGHEMPAASNAIADALRRGGFAPVCVRSGDLVLAATDPTMPEAPAAVVLDVAIPGVLAFDIVESLRKHASTRGLAVILLASVYEKTRYKRRPNRLYGADAYLELHHVPDRLASLLWSIIRQVGDDGERQQTPLERARAAALRIDTPDAVDDETSAVLARRLLSDVALYHGEEIAAGIRAGTPFSSIQEAVLAARDLHQRGGGRSTVFDQELDAFAARLLQGNARAVSHPGEGARG